MINYILQGCNLCLHPSCALSSRQNGICPCPNLPDNGLQPCGGMLIFDENSKPNWKLSCNKCNTLFRFHGSVHDIRPAPPGTICQECGVVRIVTFEFRFCNSFYFSASRITLSTIFYSKLKPLQNGETRHTGCIVCDDFLNSLTEKIEGRSMNLSLLRQQRHKRGGGGRGRGRGRGRGPPRGDAKMSFSDF